jgi:hypothetical protein
MNALYDLVIVINLKDKGSDAPKKDSTALWKCAKRTKKKNNQKSASRSILKS